MTVATDKTDDVETKVEDKTTEAEVSAEVKAEAKEETSTDTEAQAEGQEEEASTTEEEEKASKEYDKDVWGETGSDIGDGVLQVLSDSGVTPEDAKAMLWDAVKEGDVSKIDKETLIEKVGKAQATLILGGVENFVSKRQAAQEKAVSAVHEAAGGEEAWKTVLPWINKAVPEDDLKEYRSMIDAGGKQAELAVKELVGKYNADPKNKPVSRVVIEGDAVSRKEKPGISRREYGDKLSLLHARNAATPDALAELKAARTRGVKQGL